MLGKWELGKERRGEEEEDVCFFICRKEVYICIIFGNKWEGNFKVFKVVED